MPKSFAYLASLVCALSLLAVGAGARTERPMGVRVSLGERCEVTDFRQILVSYLPGGRVYLNDYLYDEAGARAEIVKIMATHQVKSLWVVADRGVDYGEVVGFVAKIQGDTPDLRIGLATESLIGPASPLQPGDLKVEAEVPSFVGGIAPCFLWMGGRG